MANYSAPMPAVGLYIAGASFVCFLFLFFDMWSGFRNRKPWLPCRFFSLNSLTLSLLAVAAKLPVDLTTPMPSALDQLSKLIGTTMICIYMGFIFPSIVAMPKSERFSNLAALTIFVITVMVNICIQMSTGVIFCFIVEHTLILFFMLLFIACLWDCFFMGAKWKDLSSDGVRDVIIKGEESTMMHRLVLCHVECYCNNPQALISTSPFKKAVGLVSALCTMVLLEALFRSLVFKKINFHGGHSDYKWSMWLVVVSQIVTVLLGCMGSLFRWINSYHTSAYADLHKAMLSVFLHPNVRLFIMMIVALLVVLPIEMLSSAFVKMMKRVGIMQQKEEVDERDVAQRKCREERERWMEVMKMKSPTHLIQLLSKIHPSQTPFSSYIQRFYRTYKYRLPHQYRVSCLSLVVLTQKAANKLERDVAASLACAFDEVFEIIYFIDKKMSNSVFDKEKTNVAKELWTKIWDLKNLQDLDSWEPFMKIENDDVSQEKLVVEILFDDSNNNIQQLFVDMICSFLAKLPQAILKDVVENQLGDDEEKIQRAIQYLMKLEKLEGLIQWEFPSETNITDLINSSSTSLRTPHQQVSSSGSSNEIEEIV